MSMEQEQTSWEQQQAAAIADLQNAVDRLTKSNCTLTQHSDELMLKFQETRKLHADVERQLSFQKSLVKQLKEMCLQKDLVLADQEGKHRGYLEALEDIHKNANPIVSVPREVLDNITSKVKYNYGASTNYSTWLNLEDNQPSVLNERNRY